MENKRRIKITVDTSSDFWPLKDEFDVGMVPQVIVLGDKDYLDGYEVGAEDVYKYYEETKKLPKTAAIDAYYTEQLFDRLSKEYEAVIHISIGEKLSTSINIAKSIAKKYDNIFVVDSNTVSLGQSLLVLKGLELVNEGKPAEEIVKALEALAPKIHVSFVVETLDFIYKGGRCTMLQMFGANLLKLKPRLDLVDGKIIATKKYRGKQRAVIEKLVRETLEQYKNIDKSFAFITYTKMPIEWAENAEKILLEAGFKTVRKVPTGANMTSHSGPGTLGVFFFAE